MNMHLLSQLALAVVLAAASAGASAQHGAHDDAGHAAPAAAELADGEVRKIDKEAGKIMLRHGELKNLNMSPMTMVFRVKDPAMLDQVKTGDKVRFAADRVNGAFTILQIEVAQ
jgi:Cu/Ag efflux protein CusF